MFTLTYTNMSMFKDCPWKFRLSVVEGLKPVVEKPSLVLGKAFHLYRERGWEPVQEMLSGIFPSNQDEADQLEISWAILKGMASVAPVEPNVEREVEWLNPLVNPATGGHSRSFNLGGKADGVVTKDDGTAILIEEKTRGGNITRVDIDKLSIDTQVLNCISNLKAIGKPVVEVHYRYYRKPLIRLRKGETVEAYCDRILEDYAERPDFYFIEEKMLFSDNQVKAHEQDLWQVGKSILWTKRHNLWWRNTSHCGDWGGCMYLPICRGEDTDGLYKVGNPNPELDKEESHGRFA